jgi:hypothetical protein
MLETHFSSALIVLLTMMAGTTTGYGDSSPLRTIAEGAFSGITQARQEVIKDQAAWSKLWRQHNRKAQPAGKVPEIDFAKEMVLVVTMGQQRTGGYAIEIVKVESAKGRLRISVNHQSPPPGAMVIQVLTAPFHMVAVAKSELKPEFVLLKARQEKSP